MMTNQDKDQLKVKGISELQIAGQLSSFEQGFPYLKLYAAASTDNGIILPDEKAEKQYLDAWSNYTQHTDHRILKFVPASGAASRMFKDLFAFLEANYSEPETDFEKIFFAHITAFAFYNELNNTCQKIYNKDVDCLKKSGQYKEIVAALLNKEGMNYGALPKGLLLFHKYGDTVRTPLEEHLVEGALYAHNAKNEVNIHFTVSHDHRRLFETIVEKKVPQYEKEFGVKYHISFSEQKSSTDTLAVDMENKPFRMDDGKLLFRPGGHGALIENLNDLDADVIFIKNIDNVVPDRLKESTVKYKKLIAGVLVSLEKQAFEYLQLIDSGKYTDEQVIEMVQFVQRKLCCRNSATKDMEDSELILYLKKKLHRPIRVCGMVKNVGEPGGGPFLVYNSDGSYSMQILESSQIDKRDAKAMEMFTKGTHFNPVDLVCAVKDYKGKKFDLTKYIDKSTGFISQKSKNGRDLKALELPGLWNGAMSDWSTIFVEVPLDTFNPVKTVNDLLREQHQ
jgi:hypothetical protein